MKLKKIFNHKFILNCCNLIFMACGAVLLFSGFYLLTDTKRMILSRLLAATSEHLNSLPQPLFYYISVGLIFSGTIISFATVLGFWASCLNRYCFLSLYFLIIIILLLIESAVCLAITIWPQCLGVNFDETKMVKTLQGNYGVPGNEQFTNAIDLIQTEYKCCGINSNINYDTSLWRLQGYGQRDWTVPLTCCKLQNGNILQSYLDPIPINLTQCQQLQKFDYENARYIDTCLDKIDAWYRDQYIIYLIASLVLAIIEFFVLLSIVLNCLKISKKNHLNKFKERNNINENHIELETTQTILSPKLIENIYQDDIRMPRIMPNNLPNEIKEVFIQPQDLYQNKHNTTFKPSKNQYHISDSFLV